MTIDKECNTVYFANTVTADFTAMTSEIIKIIQNHGYKVKILDESDDYWCRDYMPIQLSDKEYIQFVYHPHRYINSNEMEFISNPVKIQLANKLNTPRFSRLILDGGNIVRSKDIAILTDRVFEDNLYQYYDRQSIINQLKCDLSSKVIIIPQYPGEKTGHADNLIRFVDENTVVINKIKDEPETEWLNNFLSLLENYNLKYYEMPCPATKKSYSEFGLYLNFLEIGKLIIAPQYDIPEDQKAMQTFTDLYGKTHHVIPFKASWIAEYGGVFNCISWCVKL